MRLHRRLLRFVGVTQVHPVYGETSAERLARVRSRRFPLLVVHALQLVLAIVLLGLDAYNIHYVAYNVLVYGLVAVGKPPAQAYPLLYSRNVVGNLHNHDWIVSHHFPVQVPRGIQPRCPSLPEPLDARFLDYCSRPSG